jgi:hypothetical protein
VLPQLDDPAALDAERRDAPSVRGFGVPIERLREFDRPAYESYGTLSNASWERRAERLSMLLPNLMVERYEGRSHMDTSHMAEPDRVARALRRLWGIDPQR